MPSPFILRASPAVRTLAPNPSLLTGLRAAPACSGHKAACTGHKAASTGHNTGCRRQSRDSITLKAERLCILVGLSAAPVPASLAADASYNATAGSDVIRNVFGAVYVLLLTFFVARLFVRRANRGTSQRFFQPPKRQTRATELLDDAVDRFTPTSPLSALGGALQAGFLCFLLYQLTTRLDGFFDRQEVPSQFTARNITLTVQTIVRAVSYLFTFICGFNTLGLTGLTIQLLLFPDKPEDSETKS